MPARKLKPILNNKISKVYVIVGTLVAQQTFERASVKKWTFGTWKLRYIKLSAWKYDKNVENIQTNIYAPS